VGPRAVLDVVVKRKIPRPRRESNLRTPIIQPIAQRYTEAIFMIINCSSIFPPCICTSSVFLKDTIHAADYNF
jgi:hypothetical protein